MTGYYDSKWMNEAVKDAEKVRQKALKNAKKALDDAFNQSVSNGQSFYYTNAGNNVIRYHYSKKNKQKSKQEVLDIIKNKNLIILDEGDTWIDVIDKLPNLNIGLITF